MNMSRRRSRGGGIARASRRARSLTYGTSRTLGNVQPVLDFLATGRVDLLAGGLLRRGARRLSGRAFSRYAFGRGGLLTAILDMIFGAHIGSPGRW